MGLVKAGIYLGAATYIIKKIKEEKEKSKSASVPQNTQSQYPPPQQYQDTRGYPPQYQQYPPPPQQQQQQQQQQPKFGYYDTHGPYEAQYQPQSRQEERPYYSQEQEKSGRESFAKIEDAPMPRQWPGAEPVKSSKW